MVSKSERTKNYFNKKSQNYNINKSKGLWNFLSKKELFFVRNLLNLNQNDNVLDVGCGSGFYSELISKKNVSVLGIDISEKMIAEYNKNGFNGFVADAESVNLNKKFSKILVAGVIEFTKNPVNLLKNLKSQLKSEGEIVLIYPNNNLLGFLYKLFHLFHGINIKLFSRTKILSLLKKNNLSLVSLDNINFLSSAIKIKKSSLSKSITLSFDLEEYQPSIREWIFSKVDCFEYSKKGLLILLAFLKKKNIQATFFTTYTFARKYLELIKIVLDENHEIASHGFKHSDNYSNVKTSDLIKRLYNSKTFLEKSFKTKILGFRSPMLQKINSSILEELGFVYNSSMHPTCVPLRYCNIFKPQIITKNNKLLSIPISVSSKLKLPFSWFWFKLFPLKYSINCISSFFKFHSYAIMYFHSWEFNPIHPKSKILMKKLDSFVDYLSNKKINFITARNFLKQNGFIDNYSNL